MRAPSTAKASYDVSVVRDDLERGSRWRSGKALSAILELGVPVDIVAPAFVQVVELRRVSEYRLCRRSGL